MRVCTAVCILEAHRIVTPHLSDHIVMTRGTVPVGVYLSHSCKRIWISSKTLPVSGGRIWEKQGSYFYEAHTVV